MTTLSDFQKFETLKQELKDFLISKCYEFIEVKGWNDKYIDDYLGEWEITDKTIDVFFNKGQKYWYPLPLDIVFDQDFKTKLIERVLEERRLENLRLIEVQREWEEKKKVEEITTLKELIKKYPDIIKDSAPDCENSN